LASLATVAVLIPAYQPGEALLSLVKALSATGLATIVVVDDGSGPEFGARFREASRSPRVLTLRHAVNLGKGAALKTGLNYVLCELPNVSAVVTADADGQHHPEDVCRVAEAVAEYGNELVLGARRFQHGVPLRSRLGNDTTRLLFGLLIGQRLIDTQTGLRGIPIGFAPHLLPVASNGYEFELDMLVLCQHLGVRIREVEIRTIYLDSNTSSHFNPILDSMRIYFVLLRFGVLSLMTALVDNFVFFEIYRASHTILGAQVAARLIALIINYAGSRKAVFFSRERHWRILPRYLLLVFGNGVVSYGLIRVLSQSLGLSVLSAKLLVESTLFIANFTLLRDFVFTAASTTATATDWNNYYRAVPVTASLTRKYTARVLLAALREAGLSAMDRGRTIVEIGGANSCFLDRIVAELHPAAYHVVDNNRLGLDLLRARPGVGNEVVVHEGDVLNLSLALQADVVFSIGLIEHFDEADTRKAVLAHFSLLKPGGFAIISFPTPTLLYRISRSACELIGQWKFYDERPLDRTEVARAAGNVGQITFEKTLWPLVFTQRLMVFRKASTAHLAESA
jgi:glycosyltransferase involved in cell wall biosynthesis